MNITKKLLPIPEHLQNMNWNEKSEHIYQQQIANWPLASKNYAQLANAQKRTLNFDNFRIDVQFNPARARSTCANLKKTVIDKRPCFLCPQNLPKEQKGLIIHSKYLMLINPYPIFNKHFTISDFAHVPQRIEDRVIDLLSISKALKSYTIFYNGPNCGASAPDHFHFQATERESMPINAELFNMPSSTIFKNEDIHIFEIHDYLRKTIVFQSEYIEPIDYFFAKTRMQLPIDEEWDEPKLNVLSNYQDGKYNLVLFPRKTQRSSHFYRKGDEQMVISPGSVEMAGIIITPIERDFNRVEKHHIEEIFSEVSLLDFTPHY